MEIILKPGKNTETHYRLNIPKKYRRLISDVFDDNNIKLILDKNKKELVEIPVDNAVYQNHNAFNNVKINEWLEKKKYNKYKKGKPPKLVFELSVTLTFKEKK